MIEVVYIILCHNNTHPCTPSVFELWTVMHVAVPFGIMKVFSEGDVISHRCKCIHSVQLELFEMNRIVTIGKAQSSFRIIVLYVGRDARVMKWSLLNL